MRHIAAILGLTLIVGIGIVVAVSLHPWKVTDPQSPNFKPELFDPHDYHSDIDLGNALKRVFPVGTSRSYVERILITPERNAQRCFLRSSLDSKTLTGGYDVPGFGFGANFDPILRALDPRTSYLIDLCTVGGWSDISISRNINLFFDSNSKIVLMIVGTDWIYPELH